jgi:hypothetical protein
LDIFYIIFIFPSILRPAYFSAAFSFFPLTPFPICFSEEGGGLFWGWILWWFFLDLAVGFGFFSGFSVLG